jgi:hypothetical protein
MRGRLAVAPQEASAHPSELGPLAVWPDLVSRKDKSGMPRYYFDVWEAGGLTLDDEGIELLDVEAVQNADCAVLGRHGQGHG